MSKANKIMKAKIKTMNYAETVSNGLACTQAKMTL